MVSSSWCVRTRISQRHLRSRPIPKISPDRRDHNHYDRASASNDNGEKVCGLVDRDPAQVPDGVAVEGGCDCGHGSVRNRQCTVIESMEGREGEGEMHDLCAAVLRVLLDFNWELAQ